jgi:hypothetical protein
MNNRRLPNSVPEGEIWFPETEEDREAVREQLGRLLANPVFGRSKGCSNLLAYIVRRAFEGDAERLKERTIGAEVFGRAPDYDTGSDHVVRSTAGEIRKRLAQYYMEPGRSHEIRIDVPSGSYVPRFARFAVFPVAPPHEPEDIDISPVSVPEQGTVARSGTGRSRSRRVVISVAVAAAVVVSVLAIRAGIGNSGRTISGFWRPVLESPNPILVCIGAWNQSGQAAQPGPARVDDQNAQTFPDGFIRGSERVFLDDAMALARFAGWLQQNGRPYRIVPPYRVTFADLQTSPAVLIGFNNYWTTSLGDRIRFTMERGTSPDTRILRDKKNPSRNDWSVDLSTPYDRPIKDYALVVRALDPKTGQIAVTAAGLTHFGTLAASEFLTDPEQLKKLDGYGPKGWERKNMAIILSTEVIRGSPGSARIVATDFW